MEYSSERRAKDVCQKLKEIYPLLEIQSLHHQPPNFTPDFHQRVLVACVEFSRPGISVDQLSEELMCKISHARQIAVTEHTVQQEIANLGFIYAEFPSVENCSRALNIYSSTKINACGNEITFCSLHLKFEEILDETKGTKIMVYQCTLIKSVLKS